VSGAAAASRGSSGNSSNSSSSDDKSSSGTASWMQSMLAKALANMTIKVLHAVLVMITCVYYSLEQTASMLPHQ
jgi:hypothetical protein